MEILNNIDWYINSSLKTVINKYTWKNLLEKEWDTVIFDNSTHENVVIIFPLHDNYTFTEKRELPRPVTVKQFLTFIYDFYKEPLKPENIENAFSGMEEWLEDVLEHYDGDVKKLTNYDVFTDTCRPVLSGLYLDIETREYTVLIGPD